MSTIYYRKLPWTNPSTPGLTDIENPPVTNEIGNNEKTSESESSANPPEPSDHVFAWQNLTLEIDNGTRLLENVSGKIVSVIWLRERLNDEFDTGWLQPGSMTALMGMSGAGKVCTSNMSGFETPVLELTWTHVRLPFLTLLRRGSKLASLLEGFISMEAHSRHQWVAEPASFTRTISISIRQRYEKRSS